MKSILLACSAAFCLATTTLAQALYDPAPVPAIAAAEGAWRGSLQYRDYQPPFGRVTLPTQLSAALLGPNELALHYVYADGPNKIIHSYDRLKIDLPAKQLTFTAAKAGEIIVAQILSSTITAEGLDIIATVETFKEKTVKESTTIQKFVSTTRYKVRLSATEIEILKEEAEQPVAIKDGAKPQPEFEFRSKYSFTRMAK